VVFASFAGRSGVRVWDTGVGEHVLEFPGSHGTFSPDGTRIVAWSADTLGGVTVYDARPVKDVFARLVVAPKVVQLVAPKSVENINPALAQSHATRGLALAQKGDADGAIAAFREAIKHGPENAGFYNELRHLLSVKQDWVAAAAAAREAVKWAPHNSNYWLYLGGHERQLKRPAEAIAAFKEAARLHPRFAWAHSELSAVYLEQKQYPEAIAAAREAIKSDPKFTNAHAVLGLALRASGDDVGGRAALAEAVRLDPGRWGPTFRELFSLPVAPMPRAK